MVSPLPPPPKKNPQRRTRTPTRPPESRSRAALGLSAAAASGRFALQVCNECSTIQYPPRDACHECLGIDLCWQDISPKGRILAETTVRASTKLYFRERLPWRTGSVQLDAGPVVICHLHSDCARNARVTLINRLDRSGQGVLLALPTTVSENMQDDEQLRSLSCNPRHRRILISDARTPNTGTLAESLLAAGAATIFIGESEKWRPYPQRSDLQGMKNVHVLPLDVTDTASVKELAAEIGGKVDILVNNARFVRPGGVLERGDTAFAHDEMQVNYLGLIRLAQHFGPGMCARTADGANCAVAWVNILSAHCLSNHPEYGCYSASHAAAHSLSQSLRAEFRASGLRVMNLYVGPTDDEWFQSLPPPKVAPAAIARSLVDGLQHGLEEICCGDVAKDLYARYLQNPQVLERELTLAGDGA